MEITAIVLVIFSAILHALRNFLTKKAVDKELFIWWYQIFAMIFFFPLFIYFLFKENLNIPVALYFGIVSGFTHFMYWLFLAKAYAKGDLSTVYPIMRSSPALVLIFSIIILGEKISFIGGAGVVIVAIGVYTVNMEGISPSMLIKPFIAVFKDSSTRFAFFTLISVTAYSLIDKAAVEYVHPILFIYLLIIFGYLFFTPYILIKKSKTEIKKEWVLNRKFIVSSGLISVVGYTLILIAFTIERVSYIVGLRQLSVVFAVLLGSHLLKEQHKTIRFSGAAIIFSGAFLISIAK